jgi:hypothetical protein
MEGEDRKRGLNQKFFKVPNRGQAISLPLFFVQRIWVIELARKPHALAEAMSSLRARRLFSVASFSFFFD